MPVKKMHICHIIPTLAFGGAERFVVDLINHASNDIRFTIIILKDHKPLAHDIVTDDVNIVLVEKLGKVSLGLFHALEEVLEDIQPDIVHTHLFGGDFWGRVAAKRLGIPVVTTEHNINETESTWKRMLKIWLKEKTDRYSCPSDAVRRFMQETYGIAKKHITVTRLGIPVGKFIGAPTLETREPHKLLMAGRLTRQKGFDLGLQALATLKDFNWQLEIIGEGKDRAMLASLARTLGLEDRVQLLPPTYTIAEAYARNHMVLMPSRWEGLGLVAMEAMASGRLVIASKTGGLMEFIDDDETGMLSPAGDVHAFADSIRWAFEHPDDVHRMAGAAQKKALDAFGFDKTVQQYEEIYHSVLAS